MPEQDGIQLLHDLKRYLDTMGYKSMEWAVETAGVDGEAFDMVLRSMFVVFKKDSGHDLSHPIDATKTLTENLVSLGVVIGHKLATSPKRVH